MLPIDIDVQDVFNPLNVWLGLGGEQSSRRQAGQWWSFKANT